MGFWFPRLFGRQRDERAKSIEQIMAEIDGLTAAGAASGVAVTTDRALQTMAVFACVRVLAEGIAQLPMRIHRGDGNGGKVEVTDEPIADVLIRRPNGWQDSFTWRETMMIHATLAGNGYSLIQRDYRKRLVALVPAPNPGHVMVERDASNKLTYVVTLSDGARVRVAQADMFHLRGPSYDGLLGMAPVALAREAIGLSIAAEQSQSRLHANGGRPSGILSTDHALKPETAKQIAEDWKAAYAGPQNAYKTAILDHGFKYSPLAMSGVDAQHLETRKFQIEEICRGFRVFPQMIMHSDKTATYASAEQFFLAHVVHSLGPWIERFEKACDAQLIADGSAFTKLKTEGLLRGASTDRANFYRAMLEMGVYTRNEVRALEDLEPLEGLDEPLTPMNLQGNASEGSDDAPPDS